MQLCSTHEKANQCCVTVSHAHSHRQPVRVSILHACFLVCCCQHELSLMLPDGSLCKV